jgi:hypothetical protein
MRATSKPVARIVQHPRLRGTSRQAGLIGVVASRDARLITGLSGASVITTLTVFGAIAATNRIDRIAVAAEAHADTCAQRKHGSQHDGFHSHVSFLVSVKHHDDPVVGRAVNRSCAAMRFAGARARCEAETLWPRSLG